MSLFAPWLGGSGEQAQGAGQLKAEEGSETVLPRRRSVFHIEWSSIRRRSKGVYIPSLTLRPQLLPPCRQRWYPLHSDSTHYTAVLLTPDHQPKPQVSCIWTCPA